ncbi:MAG: acyl-CoA thioesterase [Burkholderiales bacterium PBB4]|nr:MAG: acyl-CoA thioesterase [Burkholderiales bacterium PBB4]
MTLHTFDQSIALTRQAEGSFTGNTHPAYANMVGPYGGTTAAQILNAVMQHPDLLGEPLSLTVNFCAGVADGAFVVNAKPARTNRSTQHWTIEMLQNGEVVTTATAVTAVRRETWADDEISMPTVPAPADVPAQTGHAPMAFIQQYDMRPIVGGMPSQWDGSLHSSLTQLWLRDQQPRPLDYASLAAMSDIFYPRVFVRRHSPTPAGTVSITTYFHANAAQLEQTGTGYLLGQARASAFRNGFSDQSAQIWNEAGVLLASSHQIVYFKG